MPDGEPDGRAPDGLAGEVVDRINQSLAEAKPKHTENKLESEWYRSFSSLLLRDVGWSRMMMANVSMLGHER